MRIESDGKTLDTCSFFGIFLRVVRVQHRVVALRRQEMSAPDPYCFPAGSQGVTNGTCVCRVSWAGSDCSVNRLYLEPQLWETYLAVQHIICPIGNGLIFFHGLVVLINKIKEGRKKSLPSLAAISIVLGCLCTLFVICDLLLFSPTISHRIRWPRVLRRRELPFCLDELQNLRSSLTVCNWVTTYLPLAILREDFPAAESMTPFASCLLACAGRGVEAIDPLCWKAVLNCGFEVRKLAVVFPGVGVTLAHVHLGGQQP
jgi:hypothetical protein